MTDLTLGDLRAELEPIRTRLDSVETKLAELGPIRAKLEGLPMPNRAITVLQQDARSLRSSFNDFARTNVTAGEIEALHADVNAVQARNAEIEIELATIKQLVDELRTRD